MIKIIQKIVAVNEFNQYTFEEYIEIWFIKKNIALMFYGGLIIIFK